MENFSDESVAYLAFREQHQSNKNSLYTMTLRQVIDNLFEIYDYGTLGEKDDQRGAACSFFRSVTLAAFGFPQGDLEDSGDRDSSSEGLTDSQEFWLNFLLKERVFVTLWMSHASLLKSVAILLQLGVLLRRSLSDKDDLEMKVQYINKAGEPATDHLPTAFVLDYHVGTLIFNLALIISLNICVGFMSGMKRNWASRQEAITWLNQFQTIAYVILVAYGFTFLRTAVTDFTMTHVSDAEIKHTPVGLLETSHEAQDALLRVTFFEIMDMMARIAQFMTGVLMMALPVPSIWWTPINGILVFFQTLYYVHTVMFRIVPDKRYAYLLWIAGTMVPLSNMLSTLSHFQNEVTTFLLAKKLDLVEKYKTTRIDFLQSNVKMNLQTKLGGLAVKLRRPFDYHLENMTDQDEGGKREAQYWQSNVASDEGEGMDGGRNSRSAVAESQRDRKPGSGNDGANSKGGKGGDSSKHTGTEKNAMLKMLFKQKCALEFEMLEMTRVADDLSLMYQIEEERVPRGNHRALVTPQSLPGVVKRVLEATYPPLQCARGELISPNDLVHRKYFREDGTQVISYLEGMIKFVFEPSALGVVGVTAASADSGGNAKEGERGGLRFCDTLTTMALDRILRWLCYRCCVNNSSNGSGKSSGGGSGGSTAQKDKEKSSPMPLFTVHFSLRSSEEVRRRDSRLFAFEKIQYPWTPEEIIKQRGPAHFYGNWDYTAEYLVVMRVESHTGPGSGSGECLEKSLSAFNAQSLAELTGGGAHYGPHEDFGGQPLGNDGDDGGDDGEKSPGPCQRTASTKQTHNNNVCWFNFGVLRNSPDSTDLGLCGNPSREILYTSLHPPTEGAHSPSAPLKYIKQPIPYPDSADAADSRKPLFYSNIPMANLRLCIVSQDEAMQEALTQIFMSAGLKKVILLKDILKEEQASDIVAMADVIVVSDKILCAQLREHGYDGPLILTTAAGFYIDRSFTDLADLTIHMPLSSYALHLLDQWLRCLCSGDKTILKYKGVATSSEPRQRREPSDFVEAFMCFIFPSRHHSHSDDNKDKDQREEKHLVSMLQLVFWSPYYVVSAVARAIWRCFLLILYLLGVLSSMKTRLVARTWADLFDPEILGDSSSDPDSVNDNLSANRNYQQVYCESAPSEGQGKNRVSKRLFLTSRFSMDKESAKWGTTLSLYSYLKDSRDMGIRFNCPDLEMSFHHWMDDGRMIWSAPRHHAKTVLTLAYLATIKILDNPNGTDGDVFIIVLMMMVCNRMLLRRTAQRLLNFSTYLLGLPDFYNLEYGFYTLFIFDIYDASRMFFSWMNIQNDLKLDESYPALKPYIGLEASQDLLYRRGFNFVFIALFASQVMRVPLEPGPVYADLTFFIIFRFSVVLILLRHVLGIYFMVDVEIKVMGVPLSLTFWASFSIFLVFISYFKSRSDKLEYQMWRLLDFKVRYLKKFDAHLDRELSDRLEEISSQQAEMSLQYYHLIAHSDQPIYDDFLAEKSLLNKAFLELENIQMVLRRRAELARMLEQAASVSRDRGSTSDGGSSGASGGAVKLSDPYALMYPVHEVSMYCERFLIAEYKNTFGIGVQLQVEPSLCAIRIQKSLFKLIFTRALSMVSKRAGKSDEKFIYHVLVRISCLETFLERDKDNARYTPKGVDEDKASELDGGEAGTGGVSGRVKSKFLDRRHLVVEVLHGSVTGEDAKEAEVRPAGIRKASNEDSTKASSVDPLFFSQNYDWHEEEQWVGDTNSGDEFLWQSCLQIMNADHLLSLDDPKNAPEPRQKQICVDGDSNEAYWPYRRRMMFSLPYQQVPLGAKIASAMKRQTALYLSKHRFYRPKMNPSPSSAATGDETASSSSTDAAGRLENSTTATKTPYSTSSSFLATTSGGGGSGSGNDSGSGSGTTGGTSAAVTPDVAAGRGRSSSNVVQIAPVFQLLVSCKQLQLFRNSSVSRSAYNTWLSSFTALQDSRNTKYFNSYAKHNLQTVVINLASDPVFHYVSKLTNHGWKVKLVEVTHLASGDVDMAYFEEASCVFLFHNSGIGLNQAYKKSVTGAMERMHVSGNLRRLIGVDLAEEEDQYTRNPPSPSADKEPAGAGGRDLSPGGNRVLCPAPKGATSEVAGAVCDFIVDAESLRVQQMLNALTQEVARENLKALLE